MINMNKKDSISISQAPSKIKLPLKIGSIYNIKKSIKQMAKIKNS